MYIFVISLNVKKKIRETLVKKNTTQGFIYFEKLKNSDS